MKKLMLILVPLLMFGCSKKSTSDSADAAAEAFAAAMTAGDTAAASKLFDYDTSARLENSDWDTFPQSQRSLIIGKLQEDKASQLSAAFASGATFTVEGGGGEGTFALKIDGAKAATLHIAKFGERWKITGIQ